MKPRVTAFAAALVFALAVDQATKAWARAVLLPIYPRVKVWIPGIWEYRYSENTGAVFGLFQNVPGVQWLFALVALLVLVGACVYVVRGELRHPVRAALEIGILAGGAVGNMIDRVLFHHVTDFVVWKFHGHEWDTFNVADAWLVVGVVAFILDGGGVKKKALAQG